MAASNAGVYEKIVILDEYLVLASITAGSLRVINIWTVPNCHRKIFAPPARLETPKISPPATSGTQVCHRAKYHADWWQSRRDICSWR